MKSETKQAKHTPGPWTWIGNNGTQIIVDYDDGSPRGCVAHVSRDGGEFSKEEAQANARLIATAPELLEYAKSLVDALSTGDPQYSMNDKEGMALNALQLAIAKAEGK